MGLFDFFKGNESPQEERSKDKHWSLTTIEGEVVDPTMDQIEAAVKNATPKGSMFATLIYNHSRLEIESIQTVGDENGYRLEALTSTGTIFVNDGLNYEETFKFFEDFYNHQRVAGFRSWPTEKY